MLALKLIFVVPSDKVITEYFLPTPTNCSSPSSLVPGLFVTFVSSSPIHGVVSIGLDTYLPFSCVTSVFLSKSGKAEPRYGCCILSPVLWFTELIL